MLLTTYVNDAAMEALRSGAGTIPPAPCGAGLGADNDYLLTADFSQPVTGG